MSEGDSVLCTLVLVSLMLAASMALSARAMEGTFHARSWCAAFLTAAAAWGLNLVYALLPVHPPFFVVLVSGLAMIVPLLLLRGFEERAGNPVRHPWLIAAGLVGLAIIIGATWWEASGLWAAVSQYYRVAVLIAAIRVVVPPGRKIRHDEQAMIALLAALAFVSMIVGTLALARQVDVATPLGELDRWLLLLALPPIFTGIGMVAMTLIATDLATRLRRLATIDLLTGILNRRGFEDASVQALNTARRQKQSVTLVMADLDRFKHINDTYGHETGDRALRAFADCAGGFLQPGDVFGRTGGEEFSIILADGAGTSAADTVDRIRRAVPGLRIDGLGDHQLTASFGMTRLDPTAPLQMAIRRADMLLYRSKAEGRNRITYDDHPVASAIRGAVGLAGLHRDT